MERIVAVDAARLERWIAGFSERHGAATATIETTAATLSADDGAQARIAVPFPPLLGDTVAGLIEHATRERTIAALLIRRGGVAVGVFDGRRLVSSKIETAYVQGRTKAGGWSQQRYARRRENQARQLTQTAAELMVSLVLPQVSRLEAVATGGDRSGVESVLADPRLSPLRALTLDRVHPVPDPRLAVLERFPSQFLAVQIILNELA